MKKTYVTNDGDKFKVKDASDLVRQMRLSSRYPVSDANAFMSQAAERIGAETGKDIPWGSADKFVEALIAVGYLKEIES